MTAAEHKQLDGLFQEKGLVQFKGKSVLSGKPAEVVHHFYGRRNHATRWFLPNAIALTHEEHMYLHNEAQEATENAIIVRLGTLWFENLRKQSNRTAKYYSHADVLEHLEGKSENYLKNWYV